MVAYLLIGFAVAILAVFATPAKQLKPPLLTLGGMLMITLFWPFIMIVAAQATHEEKRKK